MTRPHTTHHESCGCCEDERDALKAQVDRMREALVVADALIRKLFSGKVADTGAGEVGLAIAVALYATPAQSLAAHDAEVRAQALREAAEAVGLMHDSGFASDYAVAILALAERAPEVER